MLNTDPITVDAIIEAPWQWNEREKIRAIKALRRACPLHLKEAKELIEAAAGSSGAAIRLSGEQLGRLVASFHGSRTTVRIEAVIATRPEVMFDLSQML